MAQDNAERFQKMPIRAELDVREEEIELLTLDLALLAHDANLENFRYCHDWYEAFIRDLSVQNILWKH